MRLIDADALKLTFCAECDLYPDNCVERNGGECDSGAIHHLENMAPTIDAVQVVRCLDCQNRYEYLFCGYMGDNDFCSAAQPRKGGADNG